MRVVRYLLLSLCVGILIVFVLLGVLNNRSVLEEYVPNSQIDEYYLLLDGGSLRLGAEFKDDSNVFEVIEYNEKSNWVRYKQKLGMFDFETTDGVITAITVPSDMCMISSKYYVGLTESQLLSINENLLFVDTGYLDVNNNVLIEYDVDEYTQKITAMRFSTQRIKGSE